MSESTTTTTDLERMKDVLDVESDEDAYDTEIEELIAAAQAELDTAGITGSDNTDAPLIWRAICLYCKLNFKTPPDYDRLLKAWDDLLKKLAQSTGYTDFSLVEEDDDE